MLQTLATMFRYDSCGNKEERGRTSLDPYSILKKEQKAHATMQILFTPKEKSIRNGKIITQTMKKYMDKWLSV